MPNSLNVSGRLASERIPPTHVLGCEAVSGLGGDVALNALLRASLSLKLPLSSRAGLKQLEMARYIFLSSLKRGH